MEKRKQYDSSFKENVVKLSFELENISALAREKNYSSKTVLSLPQTKNNQTINTNMENLINGQYSL